MWWFGRNLQHYIFIMSEHQAKHQCHVLLIRWNFLGRSCHHECMDIHQVLWQCQCGAPTQGMDLMACLHQANILGCSSYQQPTLPKPSNLTTSNMTPIIIPDILAWFSYLDWHDPLHLQWDFHAMWHDYKTVRSCWSKNIAGNVLFTRC